MRKNKRSDHEQADAGAPPLAKRFSRARVGYYSQPFRRSALPPPPHCHPEAVKPSGGWPSIRAKALSRHSCPGRGVSPACVAREVEDQDSGHLTCESLLGGTRSTNHRYGPGCDHDSSMRTSRITGCESTQSNLRSSLRRPGPPAGCSRCERSSLRRSLLERSLDTRSGSAASSRVVPPTCAPLQP